MPTLRLVVRVCRHATSAHPLPRWPPLRSFSNAPSSSVSDSKQPHTHHDAPPPTTTTNRTLRPNDQLQDEIYDLATIGGGIVGLACTRELLNRHRGMRAVVLEKESTIAQHQSSHNSGVVHAGVYYAPGSLRAQLCTKGARLLYKYCDNHHIPYKQVGKLIVALNDREAEQIDKLYERASANGVPDLQVLNSQREIHELEPYINGVKALYTPFTGIINFGDVAQSYAHDIQQASGKIVTNFAVKKGEQLVDSDTNQSYVSIQSTDGRTVRAKRVLVAGGLYADRLAACFGGEPKPRIIPFRGSWLVVGKQHSNLVTRNIYPVPNPQFPFLGVHITPRLNGELLLGPTAALAFSREGYKWNNLNIKDIVESLTTRGFQHLLTKHFRYGVNEMLHDLFSKRYALPSVQQYMPSLEWSHITEKFSGVRAQSIGDDGALIEDFVFQAQGNSILHIRNAPSPAATSSLAVAERVADKAAEVFKL